MKIRFVVVIAIAAAVAGPAKAAPRLIPMGNLIQVQRERPGQFQRPPQRELQRPVQAPARGQRGDGRLTDDERRGLHRDLDRANREIYKGGQRR